MLLMTHEVLSSIRNKNIAKAILFQELSYRQVFLVKANFILELVIIRIDHFF